jgi:hypothetical protein
MISRMFRAFHLWRERRNLLRKNHARRARLARRMAEGGMDGETYMKELSAINSEYFKLLKEQSK